MSEKKILWKSLGVSDADIRFLETMEYCRARIAGNRKRTATIKKAEASKKMNGHNISFQIIDEVVS